MDQVRSFSSAEHNGDNAFQYFALDFKGANSAFHGSDILTQAGERLNGWQRLLSILISFKSTVLKEEFSMKLNCWRPDIPLCCKTNLNPYNLSFALLTFPSQ